ncbi:MAG: tRNA lysidine(34) synthetase TilS [Candidatus Omnitrophica bacterium]|nr:tRNA lysidine(34) synthetase TilS [Candidatus Omnitrophota bacterium]
MQSNLTERVLKTIRNYELLEPGDRVLAAVSGGPDSVFLLHVLRHLKNKLGLKDIVACNIDHGLRGRESREDSLFVSRLCKSAGVKLIQKKITAKSLKSKVYSTEEMARQARYRFFRKASCDSGANVIATGHTLDDQAETVLMRVIKGASLKGAVGILPTREDGDVRVIRPLLELEKSEIIRFLDDKRIDYRIDRTNLEPIYFRNVVRSEIVPFLERYNPRLKRALFNLAEHLREDYEFIEEAKKASKLTTHNSKLKRGKIELKLSDVVIQPAALQKELLRDALEKIGGEVKRLSFRHWKELSALIRHKRSGNSADLPGGIRITRTEKFLTFHRL